MPPFVGHYFIMNDTSTLESHWITLPLISLHRGVVGLCQYMAQITLSLTGMMLRSLLLPKDNKVMLVENTFIELRKQQKQIESAEQIKVAKQLEYAMRKKAIETHKTITLQRENGHKAPSDLFYTKRSPTKVTFNLDPILDDSSSDDGPAVRF